MHILDQIIADKKREVALKKSIIPATQLENSVLFNRSTISLSKNIKNSQTGIIAEYKRRSPSKPSQNELFSVDDVVKDYEFEGACGISVLTDGKYFGGSLDDLILARASVQMPLIRKEFIIDSYQILEAKAHGADVILLIAAVLSQAEIAHLSQFAQSLGLEVLLEIHNEIELQKAILPSINFIGVNNRNLKTFEVDLNISLQLAHLIPNEFLKISESGIDSPHSICLLQKAGYNGFLIGDYFMKTANPGLALKNLISQIIINKQQ